MYTQVVLYHDELEGDIYSDPRALTLYELMRIMSLPDDWPIPKERRRLFTKNHR